MRIAIAIIAFAISSSTDINAQQILRLGEPRDSARFQNTFIVIKGDEIRRFPSPNFMDAVNGLFPWVFSPSPNPNDYLFVVNGFVFPDINSISLNDIEEIVFIRGESYGSSFYFSKAGTFLITTNTPKDRKVKISFNSQYNTNWNKHRSLSTAGFSIPPTANIIDNDVNNKNGHYLDNHISLSWAGQKLKVYLSAGMNDQRFPRTHQEIILGSASFRDTTIGTASEGYKSQRFFVNLAYQFSKKHEIGISADYSHHRASGQLDYDAFASWYKQTTQKSSNAPVNYYHLNAYYNARIAKNFSNRLSAEYLFEKSKSQSDAVSIYTNVGSPEARMDVINRLSALNKKYLIRDQLRYDFLPGKDFSGSLSLTFIYMQRNISDEGTTQNFQNGQLAGVSFYKFAPKEKIAAMNPMFNFSYRQLISGYFGTSSLIGKKTFKDVEKGDKTGIYSGVELSLTPLLKSNKGLTTLSLSSAYSHLPRNTSADYWLNPLQLSSGIHPYSTLEQSTVNYSPYQASLSRNKLLVISLVSGFLNNRLQFITEWSQLKSEKVYGMTITAFPPMIIYLRGAETNQGLSFVLSGKVVDNDRMKFKSGFNLLFPKTKLDATGTAAGSRPYQSTMRAGWQNQLEFKRIFLQANAILDLEHVYYTNTYPVTTKKHNEFCLNYFLLGYRPQLAANSRIKGVAIFLQARNLIASERLMKNYEFDHYAGAGINLSF